jgi:hypothetical protein
MRKLLAVGLITVAVISTQATAKADKPGVIAAIDALFTRYNALWNEGNTDASGSKSIVHRSCPWAPTAHT